MPVFMERRPEVYTAQDSSLIRVAFFIGGKYTAN